MIVALNKTDLLFDENIHYLNDFIHFCFCKCINHRKMYKNFFEKNEKNRIIQPFIALTE